MPTRMVRRRRNEYLVCNVGSDHEMHGRIVVVMYIDLQKATRPRSHPYDSYSLTRSTLW